MIDIIKKELFVYTALLTVLIFLMHPDLLSEPTGRLALMQEKSNYVHPLLYAFFVYLIVYFFRAAFSLIKKMVKRGKD